jgi:Oxidoreductase-like protein, N-terminal
VHPNSPDDDPPPVAPTPPDDDACCGNGCDPCVYDLFEAERERYLIELRAWQERQARRAKGTRPA